MPTLEHPRRWSSMTERGRRASPSFVTRNRGGGERVTVGTSLADEVVAVDEEGAGEGRSIKAHPKAVTARREVAHGLLAACYPIGGGHGVGNRTTRWRGAVGDGCSRCSRERRRWWCASPSLRWTEVAWPCASEHSRRHSSPAMVGGRLATAGWD
jgi:hypothetical protein